MKFYCDINIHLEVAPICNLTALWKFDLKMSKGSFTLFQDDFPTALGKEERNSSMSCILMVFHLDVIPKISIISLFFCRFILGVAPVLLVLSIPFLNCIQV